MKTKHHYVNLHIKKARTFFNCLYRQFLSLLCTLFAFDMLEFLYDQSGSLLTPVFNILMVYANALAGSLLTPVTDTVFYALSLAFSLHSTVLITTYFKESDWLLKNFHQSKIGWKSYRR